MMSVDPIGGAAGATPATWHPCWRHVVEHWRGRLPLARSFWFDLVALSLLVWQSAALAARVVPIDTWPRFYVALAGFVLFWLLVYPWQLVGVVRAARRDVSTSLVLAPVAPLAAVLMVLVAIPQGVELLHTAQVLRGDVPDPATTAPAPVRRSFSIVAIADGTLLHLSGALDYGVTSELHAVLLRRPHVTGIVLDSEGGPVYEARGVGRLILERGLDTYTLRECNSACTIAFVAGARRWLAPGARLGFHRYRVAGQGTLVVDVDKEQRSDLDFYAARGVTPEFLDRLFNAPHDRIWFPARETLLAAGIVTGTLDAADAARLETPPRAPQ